jgi:3-oxoacyl-[acyl-carrier protein] reductase
MEDASLKGKAIIVTGAAQGIGKGIVALALARGACVAAVDVNADGLAALDSDADGRVLRLTGSVADPEFVGTAVEQTVARFGAVHGLVNNAGVIRPALIEKMSLAAWRDVLDVHLSGSFYFLQAVGRHMLERAQAGDRAPGAIVNISSDAGRRGSMGQINYAAAKAGVFGLTMSAAREWAKYAIRVNTVCFGVVETPMTETIRSERFRETYLAQIPLGRWGTAGEVARPVCFLLSDEASYITGQHLSVNGGYTIGL